MSTSSPCTMVWSAAVALSVGTSLTEVINRNCSPAGPSITMQQQQPPRGKHKQKSVVRGAQNGKLLPGEKAKLRKEKIHAKRAAREASRGFDVLSVHAQLQEFVQSGGDLMALPHCGRHGLVRNGVGDTNNSIKYLCWLVYSSGWCVSS